MHAASKLIPTSLCGSIISVMVLPVTSASSSSDLWDCGHTE